MNLNNTLQMGFDNKMAGQMQNAGRVNPQDAAKIRDLAKQFEGFFVYTALEQMSAGIKTDENVMGGGHAEKIWRGMLNEKMSEVMTSKSHRGFGIADAIERQLLQYQEVSQ